jgi:capsular exopolysaccharide synthesis family protein
MTETEYPVQEEQTFDFKKLLARILKNWYWIAISVVIGVGVATWINRYTNPMFSSSATLIINDERKSTAELLINALDRFNARRNIENEIAILRSYRMAYKTLSELDFGIFYYKIGDIRQTLIYKSAPFKVTLDTARETSRRTPVNIKLISESEYEVYINGGLKLKKRLKYGEYFRHPSFNFTITLNNPGYFVPSSDDNYMFVVNDINQLASQYSRKLNVSSLDKKGTVLTLQTTGPVAQMESDYINKLMEVYIRTGLEEKNQTAINTINFIDGQLASVVDSLNYAEARLQKFKTKSNMMEITEEGQYLFGKINELQKNRASMEVERRYYEYLQDYLQSKKDFSTVIAPTFIGISESPLALNLAQLVELYKERKTLLLTATKNNPAILAIDERIQSSIDALQENLSEAVKITSDNIRELEYQSRAIEAEMVQLPSTERILINIQRAYKLNDEIYNFLLQKRADAAIARASNVADNKILDISRSENSAQISPQTSRNRMIGLLMGFLIPVGILFLIEFFNPIVADATEVKKLTKTPVIGSVGHNERDSEIPVAANPQSAIAESFRALRTNLQYMMRESHQKVICVTSTVSGEGKTFTSVNLAAIIAQSSRKTLLVSLDLRKPKVHKVFNMDNKVGLSNYLIDKAKYEDVVKATNIRNLFITVAGPVPPNPAELIETSRMEEFIHHANQDFDMIILDTPPLAIVTDATLLSRHADVTLFVVRANYSSTDVLKLVEDIRTKGEIKNLGVVVNDITFDHLIYGKKNGYKYGYSYGYGYGKGQGYYGEDDEVEPKKWWKKRK